MKISLVTPTGGRPEAFALCERWMARQTVKFDQWIVFDDVSPRTAYPQNRVEVLRPLLKDEWQPGQNTLARNLLLGLQQTTGDLIFFIEDDDYYPPDYIANTVSYWKGAERKPKALGYRKASYYHLPTSTHNVFHNMNYASLCQTVIHSSTKEQILSVLGGTIDVDFWALVEDLDGFCLIDDNGGVIGIKGMPGRPGIGVGHKNQKGWFRDSNCRMLQKWVGQDYIHYLPYVGKEHQNGTPLEKR